MKTKTWVLTASALLCIICGCKPESKNSAEHCNAESIEQPDYCCCPPVIYIQPLNGFSKKQAKRVAAAIGNFTKEAYGDSCVEILPNVVLGKESLNSTGSRYSGPKILDKFKLQANNHSVIICLLNEDISTTLHNRDWGVLGLSYKGKYVAVASTYRVKDAGSNFHKTVIHEFCHAYFGLPHCPKDDVTCYMKDAKGHPRLSLQKGLCAYCAEHLWDNF